MTTREELRNAVHRAIFFGEAKTTEERTKAAIRVVLEAAIDVAEDHARDSRLTPTQYLMGRHYAARSITTGIYALMPEELNETVSNAK